MAAVAGEWGTQQSLIKSGGTLEKESGLAGRADESGGRFVETSAAGAGRKKVCLVCVRASLSASICERVAAAAAAVGADWKVIVVCIVGQSSGSDNESLLSPLLCNLLQKRALSLS